MKFDFGEDRFMDATEDLLEQSTYLNFLYENALKMGERGDIVLRDEVSTKVIDAFFWILNRDPEEPIYSTEYSVTQMADTTLAVEYYDLVNYKDSVLSLDYETIDEYDSKYDGVPKNITLKYQRTSPLVLPPNVNKIKVHRCSVCELEFENAPDRIHINFSENYYDTVGIKAPGEDVPFVIPDECEHLTLTGSLYVNKLEGSATTIKMTYMNNFTGPFQIPELCEHLELKWCKRITEVIGSVRKLILVHMDHIEGVFNVNELCEDLTLVGCDEIQSVTGRIPKLSLLMMHGLRGPFCVNEDCENLTLVYCQLITMIVGTIENLKLRGMFGLGSEFPFDSRTALNDAITTVKLSLTNSVPGEVDVDFIDDRVEDY